VKCYNKKYNGYKLNKQKSPICPWVLIIVIIISGWFFYNRYASSQTQAKYNSERALCVSEAKAQNYYADPVGYCNSISNSVLNSAYKVGQ